MVWLLLQSRQADMGAICCKDDYESELHDEAHAPNPKPPHADWAARARGDFGSDMTAVARDFPRMKVVVGRAAAISYVDTSESPSGVAPGAAAKPAASPQARAKALGAVMEAIAALVGPGDGVSGATATVPPPHGAALVAAVRAAAVAHLHTEDADASPDLSGGVAGVLAVTGMFPPRPDAAAADADGDAAALPTQHSEREAGGVGAATPPSREKTPLSAVCPAFKVLLCFAQGTLFYPGQRIVHLVYLPWAPHLRDVGWTAFVLPSEDVDDVVAALDAARVGGPAARRGGGGRAAADTAGDDERAPILGPGRRSGGGSNTSPLGASAVDYGSDGETHVSPSGGSGGAARASGPASPFGLAAPAPGTTVSVLHRHISRNFVEPGNESVTPRFEVTWTMEIQLDRRTGDWVAAAMRPPMVACLSAPSRNALFKGRRVRLSDVVFNAWGVDVHPVEAFAPVDGTHAR